MFKTLFKFLKKDRALIYKSSLFETDIYLLRLIVIVGLSQYIVGAYTV